MTSPRAAVYGVGAAMLVACLAAANMPSQDTAAPAAAPRGSAAHDMPSLADEVQAQAARLRLRMADAPAPDGNPRNPFSFAERHAARPAVAAPAAPAAVPEPVPSEPPLPQLLLMGIAEEATPAGPRRTAVIGGDGDTLYMVTEGQPVGTRYKVTRIGADAVELEDLVTRGYRRIAMR
jgi:Tfp pilus assembly protein PilP